MRKKICMLMIVILLVQSGGIASAQSKSNFKDVAMSSWYYTDVMKLTGSGVLNGYVDGTFRPSRLVSVQEFLKMVVNALGYKVEVGVAGDWSKPYIQKAISLGLINENSFVHYDYAILREEMASIIQNALKLDYANKLDYAHMISDYSKIPETYKDAALNIYISGIMTGFSDGSMRFTQTTSRAEAATVIIRMIDSTRRVIPVYQERVVKATYSVRGIEMGMSYDQVVSRLGVPTETLPNERGFNWLVYADRYESFCVFGIQNGVVVAYYSNVLMDSKKNVTIGTGRTILENTYGSMSGNTGHYYVDEDLLIHFYLDQNNNDKIMGILVEDPLLVSKPIFNADVEMGLEKLLFYITNSERKKYGLTTLFWSSAAEKAISKHCQDMAENGFFNHVNLLDETFSERLNKEGIINTFMAENIAAGQENVFEALTSWMSSTSGHRENVLSKEPRYLGTGVYIDRNSKYSVYYGQDLYK